MNPHSARWLVTAAMVGIMFGIGLAVDDLPAALEIGGLVVAGFLLGFMWAAADIAIDRRRNPQRRQ